MATTETRDEAPVAHCAGMDAQRATKVPLHTTGPATPAQPPSLKALAQQVLARNQPRNASATPTQPPVAHGSAWHAQEIAGMRLSQFKARRLAVLVRSSVLGEAVVFAADPDCVPAAWRDKPLYLADELAQLHGADAATLRDLHRIKTQLGGVVLRHAPTTDTRQD